METNLVLRVRRLAVSSIVTLVMLSSTSTLSAQSEPSVPPPAQSPQPDCSNLAKKLRPVVVDAYRLEAVRGTTKPGEAPPPALRKLDAKLRDTIAIKVANLDTLLLQQECDARAGRKKSIVLYLDDYPLVDVVAQPPNDPNSGVMTFLLKRTETSREVWTQLLRKPKWSPRPTKVSLGIEDLYAIESRSYIELRVLPHGWFCFWAGTLLVLVIVFGIMVWRSDILRDTLSPARPWSLARVQAAWWFFVVLACYLFIGLITGDYSTSITGTVLVLLGISSGTALAGVVIDVSKTNPQQRTREAAAVQQLNTEIQQIQTDIGALNANLKTDPRDAEKTIQRLQKITELQAKQSALSEGFFKDIMSDANGVNFHRFQIAAWTVVLGIIFVVQVLRELAMPQFDETLLGLMGLSALTYVGLKIPEPNVPTT